MKNFYFPLKSGQIAPRLDIDFQNLLLYVWTKFYLKNAIYTCEFCCLDMFVGRCAVLDGNREVQHNRVSKSSISVSSTIVGDLLCSVQGCHGQGKIYGK